MAIAASHSSQSAAILPWEKGVVISFPWVSQWVCLHLHAWPNTEGRIWQWRLLPPALPLQEHPPWHPRKHTVQGTIELTTCWQLSCHFLALSSRPGLVQVVNPWEYIATPIETSTHFPWFPWFHVSVWMVGLFVASPLHHYKFKKGGGYMWVCHQDTYVWYVCSAEEMII